METWYRTRFNDVIEPVSIVKHTEKTVSYMANSFRGAVARRANRRSSFENYFPTFEEAKGFLIGRAEERIAGVKREIEEAPAKLDRSLKAAERALQRVQAIQKAAE